MKNNINLLPLKYKQNLKLKCSIFKIVAIVSTIFFIMILFVTILNKTINDYNKKILNLDNLITNEKFIKSEETFKELEKLKNKTKIKEEILSVFNNKNNNNQITTIIKNITPNIDILELDDNRKENKINLVFRTEDDEDMSVFIKKLDESNIFYNIYLTGILKERFYNKVSLELDYKNGINNG